MNKSLLTTILTFLLGGVSVSLQAQYYYLDRVSYTIGINTIKYNGDISQSISNFRPGATVAITFPLAEKVHLRFHGAYGSYQAADSLSSKNKIRNLSFKSPLAEIGGTVIYEPLKNSRSEFFRKAHISPYLLYGLNFFYISPSAKYQGTWYDLQELGTEGQNLPSNLANSYPKPYKKYQFGVPIGGGISYYVNSGFSFNVECMYHFTFTDYMDDVGAKYYPNLDILKAYNPIAAALSNRSTQISVNEQLARGNPNKKDGYLLTTVSITYHIPQKRW